MEQLRSVLHGSGLPDLELATTINVVAKNQIFSLIVRDGSRRDASIVDLSFLHTSDAVQIDRNTAAHAEHQFATGYRHAWIDVSGVIGRKSDHADRLEIEQSLKGGLVEALVYLLRNGLDDGIFRSRLAIMRSHRELHTVVVVLRSRRIRRDRGMSRDLNGRRAGAQILCGDKSDRLLVLVHDSGDSRLVQREDKDVASL